MLSEDYFLIDDLHTNDEKSKHNQIELVINDYILGTTDLFFKTNHISNSFLAPSSTEQDPYQPLTNSACVSRPLEAPLLHHLYWGRIPNRNIEKVSSFMKLKCPYMLHYCSSSYFRIVK